MLRDRDSWTLALALALSVACGGSASPSQPSEAEAGPGEPSPAEPGREGAAAARPSASSSLVPELAACDDRRIHSLVDVLRRAEPARRAELVTQYLLDACEAPDFLRYYVEVTTPGSESRRLATTGPVAQQQQALRRVCPEAEAVMRAVAASAAAERSGILFDGCHLDRFDVIEREAYVRERGSPLPWITHQWLLDQGVAPADAVVITRAMIVHDLRATSPIDPPAGLVLPTLADGFERLADGPVVYVSGSGIEASSRLLVRIADGAIEPAMVASHLVGPLFDVVAEEADKDKQIAEARGADWDAAVVIVADEQLPFSILIDVYYTVGRAEYRRWDLGVATQAGGYGRVPVGGHSVPFGSTPIVGPPLTVIIDPGGFLVGTPDDPSPERLGVRAAIGHDAWDFEALARRAVAHRERHPDALSAVVMPERDTPHGVIVRALAALRGPECHGEQDCILPQLQLAVRSE
ncbi:MAG: hypothetical protein H6712_18520 [Myxococcales bacterium]|nr:hypothetical protein [Myxococcales bacterium]MCB9715868.1 hypothetical protein [Myxococcales bacterium]